MAKTSTWKSIERRHAAALGGERIPVSGRTIGSAPDITAPGLAVEVKYRMQVPKWLYRKIDDTNKDAGCNIATVDYNALPGWVKHAINQAELSSKDDELPIVIIHKKGQQIKDTLVLVYWDYIAEYIDWLPGENDGQIALMRRDTFDRDILSNMRSGPQ